jgi:anti-sigma B factor antagonist
MIPGRVSVEADGSERVVRFEGELDLASVPALHQEVLAGTAGAKHVVLDLSDVTWLDSTGLRLLDDLTRVYEGRSAAVLVVAPPDVPARFTLNISAWRPDLIVGRMTDAPAG